jgi:two-component system sensor histidine kinase KdpD
VGRSLPSLREIALALAIIAVCTLAGLALRSHIAATNVAMIYLLGVVAIAMLCRRQVSVAGSFVSVAAFDFFCVPPYNTLSVADYEYLLTFAGMLVVALVISTQTERIRRQAADAVQAARLQVQAEQTRSSLLSAASHDLRTPLASITGAASTLSSQGGKLHPETRQELLESIAEEADRLGRLVGNLLDMTRLESGIELRREYCPLEEIVGAALQRMERELGGRQVTTNLPGTLPPVYVDDVLLGQLLVNLIDNATRYTPPGTPIELAAEADRDAVTLEVRDRGPGLMPEEQHKIFERFYRGQAGGPRGSGLGLAICRAIVEAHRGTIEALNRAGGGAVFRIRLPLGNAS